VYGLSFVICPHNASGSGLGISAETMLPKIRIITVMIKVICFFIGSSSIILEGYRQITLGFYTMICYNVSITNNIWFFSQPILLIVFLGFFVFIELSSGISTPFLTRHFFSNPTNPMNAISLDL